MFKKVLLGLIFCLFILSACSVAVSEENPSQILPINTTTSTENLVEKRGGYVSFWFDDGLESTYKIAYPKLNEKGWKGVIAVISDNEIAREKFVEEGDVPISWEQLNELYGSGWEISSHSQTHSRLNEITDIDELRSEIIHSKKDLETRGFEVSSFTFPYGQNGKDQGQKMITQNYYYWRSSVEEINPVPAWRHLTSFVLTEEIAKEDIEEWIQTTEETEGWLIIMLHAIVKEPVNIWQHTEEQFTMVIDTVAESTLEVVLPSEMFTQFGYAEGFIPVLYNEQEMEVPNTIGVDTFKENVYLKIPKLGIDENLALLCNKEGNYDFSILHKNPIWICPDTSLFLSDIGNYGASIILGHRQWGPTPKIFAELDLMEENDIVSIESNRERIDFNVTNIIVIDPEELWNEIANYDTLGKEDYKSFLILITCTPYGTDEKRLLVVLERSN